MGVEIASKTTQLNAIDFKQTYITKTLPSRIAEKDIERDEVEGNESRVQT